MSNAENAPSRSKSRWFPRLVLIGVVVAFGYLYLSSLDRSEGSATDVFLHSLANLSPIPISTLPGSSSSAKPPETPKDAVKPVAASEVAASAASLPSASYSAPVPVAVTPAPEPASGVSSVPPQVQLAEAPAKSVESPVSAPAVVATASAPAATVDAPAAQPSPVQLPYGWEAMAQHRARMQGHYEAMRRQADEQMRQYWNSMRVAAPAPGFYAYPGYPGYVPPAYAPPAYAPGAYGAPR
jgi:hypothetical protein